MAALTGLTARQLQLWDAGGLLSPTIPSHRTDAGGYTERRYTPIELFELLVLADLRRRGFTIQQLHPILQHAAGTVRRASVRRDRRRRHRAAADRRPRDLRAHGGGSFFNLLKTPTQPLLVIGNEGLLKDLSSSMRPRRRRKTKQQVS